MSSDEAEWDELFERIKASIAAWRRENPTATLTAIEEKVDDELSQVRVQMVTDLAHAGRTQDLTQLAREERPLCPECGTPLVANGRQRRRVVTKREQVIDLARSKGYCPACGASFFPPG